MTPLEQMLRETGAAIEWPATPDLAAAVVPRIQGLTDRQMGDARRIERGDAPRRSAWIRRRAPRAWIRRPLVIAIAALLLLAATAAAIPGVRDPVLDWLGLRSVEIKRVPRPLPEVPGARLNLGTRVSLDDALAKLEFRPVVPMALPPPTVYYDPFPPGGQLALAYRNDIVITQVQGRPTEFLAKFIPPGTRVDRIRIGGDRALWIHGGLHQYAYYDRDGQVRDDSVRTAGNVLLWRHRGLLIRIEGVRSKQRAVAVARSAREVP